MKTGRIAVILIAFYIVLLPTAACKKKETPGQEPRYVLTERVCPGVFKIVCIEKATQVFNAGRQTRSSGPVEVNFGATLTVSTADVEGLYHATFEIDRVRVNRSGLTVDTNEPEAVSPTKQGWLAAPEPAYIREKNNAKHELYRLAASFTEAPVNLVFDANMTLIERTSNLQEKVTDASSQVKEVFEQMGFNLDELFTEAVTKSCREMLPKHKAGIGALWRFTSIRDILGAQVEWVFTGELEQVIERDGRKIAHITYQGSTKGNYTKIIKISGKTFTVKRIRSHASGTLLFDIGLGFPKQMIFDNNSKVWMNVESQQLRCDTYQEMSITFTKLR